MRLKTRGVRGATTVVQNTKEAMKAATVELLEAILRENEIEREDIACAIFTVTKDLNAAFPALFAREELNFGYVPMMCYEEMDVPEALPMCLRMLVLVNTEKSQKEIAHQYLRGAEKLRPDLK
jgi:chorismate mutase